MKQITMCGLLEEIDELVNNFEAKHKVKATQSYCTQVEGFVYHYRVLFYEE